MILATMATMPSRAPYIEEAIESIRLQVDAVRIYLNNFDEIPAFLSREEVVLSQDAAGDLGAEGKFYWFNDEVEYDYYLPIDDDLHYPPNYVQTLQEEFEVRNRKAIVGVHGFEFQTDIESYITSRRERYRFYDFLEQAQSVHVLGTATILLSREVISFDINDFPKRNMADLQLAILAQR